MASGLRNRRGGSGSSGRGKKRGDDSNVPITREIAVSDVMEIDEDDDDEDDRDVDDTQSRRTTTTGSSTATEATVKTPVTTALLGQPRGLAALSSSKLASPSLASFFLSASLQDKSDNTARPTEKDGGISILPLKERNRYFRLDVAPFVVLYAALLYLDAKYHSNGSNTDTHETTQLNSPTTTIMSTTALTVLWSVALLMHLATVLASQWSSQFRAIVGYVKLNSSALDPIKTTMCDITHVLIVENNNSNNSNSNNDSRAMAIVPVTRIPLTTITPSIQGDGGKNRTIVLTCEYQHKVYRWSSAEPDDDVKLWMVNKSLLSSSSSPQQQLPSSCTQFRPRFYPIQLSCEFYTHVWQGHSIYSANLAYQVYGSNTTQFQLPSFYQLLLEQLLAPFFIFQLLCVMLWSLDEFFYYAIYTLLALVTFEATMAYNRLHSLQRLNTGSSSSSSSSQSGSSQQHVFVYRNATLSSTPNASYSSADDDTTRSWIWMMVSKRELVPGDVVSVRPGMTVPADIVLTWRGCTTAVCDEALLTGESIPQLKHPLEVESSTSSSTSHNVATKLLDLNDPEHKESILFGGTVLLAATMDASNESTTSPFPNNNTYRHRALPPDNGVVGVVLRTGFETSQGSLLRTLASTSNATDSVHNWDTFVFIALLLVCAVLAATFVLHHGWHDERRNRFRLLLHVVIIITSVVPPELPMELSLAVTNSVADLMRRAKVYCTEHHRIPIAGEVNVCCFDKTGTLTSDEMRLKGVRLVSKNVTSSSGESEEDEEDALVMPDEGAIPWPTLRIMAACHSLAVTGVMRQQRRVIKIVGDPLETAVLKHTGFDLMGGNTVTPQDPALGKAMTILHRFTFSAKLKRMTTLVVEEGKNTMLALCKGAPETIKELCTYDIPVTYDDIAFHHMKRGRRVLAMAYREIGPVRDLVKYKDGGRGAIERNLTFAGFLVLDCPLKPDSKAVITELRKSQHRVVMITGDALLTATEVARQVGIIKKASAKRTIYHIHEKAEGKRVDKSDALTGFECVPLLATDSDMERLQLSLSSLTRLKTMERDGEASFCMTGDVLLKVAAATLNADSHQQARQLSVMDEKHQLLHPSSQDLLSLIVPLISIFARHTPHQKEAVVAAFNRSGHVTCMCGDGTNDVGALKRANVGISIISAPEVESKQRSAAEKLQQSKKAKKERKKSTKTAPATIEDSLRELRDAQQQLDHVELGDASVAAPFTSRQVSIKCCKDVIQQGRCTLVSMLSIYKILGINCLVNAMVLSKLFLHGAKQGDRQLTILGFAVAALFYFVTRAEPLTTLSSIRPPSSVLCLEAILSITLQFLVHCAAILAATEAALAFVDPYDPSLVPDGPFNPNVLNTCTFLMMCVATINTFAVNYRGRPFMADLKHNTFLYRTLQTCYVVLGVCALEVFPPLNDLLQLTALPTRTIADSQSLSSNSTVTTLVEAVGFPAFLCGLMVVDTAMAFGMERWIVRRFEGTEPETR